jgi:FkbM family methyltransferase
MRFAQKLSFWISKLSHSVLFNVKYRLNKWANIEGILFPVYPEYGYDVLRFIDNGKYESGEIEIIKETLKGNDRVLELGTGLGFISAYCSKKIGSESVFTFEANPYLEKKIRELYSKNNVNPHLVFAILGKEEGKSFFYRNQKSLLASDLHGASSRNNQQIEVVQLKLNDKINEIKATYLIMDIEGGEYEIFKQIDFQTIKKVQFELHPDILDETQITTIFKRLEESGFTRDHAFKGLNNYYFSR